MLPFALRQFDTERKLMMLRSLPLLRWGVKNVLVFPQEKKGHLAAVTEIKTSSWNNLTLAMSFRWMHMTIPKESTPHTQQASPHTWGLFKNSHRRPGALSKEQDKLSPPDHVPHDVSYCSCKHCTRDSQPSAAIVGSVGICCPLLWNCSVLCNEAVVGPVTGYKDRLESFG